MSVLVLVEHDGNVIKDATIPPNDAPSWPTSAFEHLPA